MLGNVYIFNTIYRDFLLCSFVEEENKDNRDVQESLTMRRARETLRDFRLSNTASKRIYTEVPRIESGFSLRLGKNWCGWLHEEYIYIVDIAIPRVIGSVDETRMYQQKMNPFSSIGKENKA
uniref:Uncharacterized protein n=1 Tax=Glossina morsitans morsitans TaxID=37546 RepID=A0ABK9NFZ8_GLOMM